MATVGDIDHLDQAATEATIGAHGAEETRQFLDRVRAEAPEDPIWTGVDAITDAGSGVRVHFHEGVDPALRRAGGVDVACVLYPDDATADETVKSDRAQPVRAPEPAAAVGVSRRTVGLVVAGLVGALLPYLVFVGFTNETTANGVLTSYTRVNLFGIVGGLVAIACGWALFGKGGRGDGRTALWKTVGVVVALLGALQFLHGSSLLTQVSPCQSDQVDSTWCR